MSFFETSHCKSKAHCKRCRDKEGGRDWRIQVAGHFSKEPVEPDFECPYGKKWSKPEPKPKKSGCAGCAKRAKEFQKLLQEQKKLIAKATKTQ